MFEKSVVRLSGQWWKLVVSGLLVIVGVVGLVFFPSLLSGGREKLALYFLVVAFVFGLGALVFACVSLRCPSCRARWVWAAVSQRDHREWLMYSWLGLASATAGPIMLEALRKSGDS